MPNLKKNLAFLSPERDESRSTRIVLTSGANDQRAAVFTSSHAETEEVMIVDPRARLGPAQMVEQKLMALLKNGVMLSLVRSSSSYPNRGRRQNQQG